MKSCKKCRAVYRAYVKRTSKLRGPSLRLKLKNIHWPEWTYHDNPNSKYCIRHSTYKSASSAQRRAKKLNRTPSWADSAKIRKVYEECKRLNAEAGRIAFHVDHVVPLNGKRVSGLHVHYNLQVLAKADNIRKSNHFNGFHLNHGRHTHESYR